MQEAKRPATTSVRAKTVFVPDKRECDAVKALTQNLVKVPESEVAEGKSSGHRPAP